MKEGYDYQQKVQMNGKFSHLNCDEEKPKAENFLQQQTESRAKLRHRLEEMAKVLGLQKIR
jgi:alanine racemase